MRAEPKMDTQGPMRAMMSKPLTNSLITLKMVHESFVLMSFHVWGLKSLRICRSISLTGIPAAGRFSSFSMTYVYGLSSSDAVLSS